MDDTNTPLQPPQPPQPPQPFQTPPNNQFEKSKDNKKRLFIIAGIVVATFVIVFVFFLALGRILGDPDTQKGFFKPTFTDWLKPAKELKVGEFRYISACQLLPEDAVVKIFGELSGSSVIWEDYIDQSLPNSRNEAFSNPTTECLYRDGRTIRISVEHFTEKKDLRDSSYLIRLAGSEEEIAEGLKRFEGVQGLGSSEGAKTFVGRMKDSVAKLNTYTKKQDDSSNSSDVTLDTLTLPDRAGIEDFTFTATHKNLIVKVSHNVDKERRDDDKPFSDQELVKELEIMEKVFAEIRKNASNPALSQSPAPTVRGTTDKLGSTPLLEACKILDAEAFTVATGIQPNNIVERQGLSLDPSIEDRALNGSLILPSSECVRGYSAKLLPASQQLSTAEQPYGKRGYLTLRLDIGHANSVKQADTVWAEYLKGFNERAVTTTADEAFFWGGNGPTQGAIFRVGPYICGVSFIAAQSAEAFGDINDVDVDEAKHIAAIDQVVANIKDLQKKR